MKKVFQQRIRTSAMVLGVLAAGVTYPLVSVNRAQAATNPSIIWNMLGTSHYLSDSNNDGSDLVNAFVYFHGILYAGTDSGVYAYSNGKWSLVGSSKYLDLSSNPGSSDSSNLVNTITVLNGILYAGTHSGVYAYNLNASGSTADWKLVGSSTSLSGTSGSNFIHSLANVNGTLYAGTDGAGVLSYDSVTNKWNQVGTGVALSSTSPSYSIYSPNVSVLRYVNWTLYAGTDGAGVYKLDPSAATPTWTPVGKAAFISGLHIFEAPGEFINDLLMMNNVLYAATVNGVFEYMGVSPTDPSGWKQLGNPVLSGASLNHDYGSSMVNSLTEFNGLLYAGTYNGVYYYGLDSQWHSYGDHYLDYPNNTAKDGANRVNVVMDPPPLSLYAGTQFGAYSFNTAPFAPPTPTHNSVTWTGWTETWKAVAGASSYNLYIDGKLYKSNITGAGSQISLPITGEHPATHYKVTVTALNGKLQSAQSSVDPVTTLGFIAPTLTHSNVTTTGWNEAWKAVTGATSYNLYIDGKEIASKIAGTSYKVTGESPATTYQVTATAVYPAGVSPKSAVDPVTTLSPPPTPAPTPEPVKGATKPVTGVPVLPWTAGGILLTLAGAMFVFKGRHDED